jgi:hypothetical protein
MIAAANDFSRLGDAASRNPLSSSRPRQSAPLRRKWRRRVVRLKRAMTGPRMMAALEAYLMRLPPCCM